MEWTEQLLQQRAEPVGEPCGSGYVHVDGDGCQWVHGQCWDDGSGEREAYGDGVEQLAGMRGRDDPADWWSWRYDVIQLEWTERVHEQPAVADDNECDDGDVWELHVGGGQRVYE